MSSANQLPACNSSCCQPHSRLACCNYWPVCPLMLPQTKDQLETARFILRCCVSPPHTLLLCTLILPLIRMPASSMLQTDPAVPRCPCYGLLRVASSLLRRHCLRSLEEWCHDPDVPKLEWQTYNDGILRMDREKRVSGKAAVHSILVYFMLCLFLGMSTRV